MVCQACGGPVGANVRFCTMCGAQVIAVPTAPQQYAAVSYVPLLRPLPRVARHLQTLGTLWCVMAALRIVEGLVGAFFVRIFAFHRWRGNWDFSRHGHMLDAPWMHIMPFIAAATVVSALFAAFVGWSLLTRRTYGRWLAIVAAVLILFKLPFGTALGIYTLWVLAPVNSAMEYDNMAEPG